MVIHDTEKRSKLFFSHLIERVVIGDVKDSLRGYSIHKKPRYCFYVRYILSDFTYILVFSTT